MRQVGHTFRATQSALHTFRASEPAKYSPRSESGLSDPRKLSLLSDYQNAQQHNLVEMRIDLGKRFQKSLGTLRPSSIQPKTDGLKLGEGSFS